MTTRTLRPRTTTVALPLLAAALATVGALRSAAAQGQPGAAPGAVGAPSARPSLAPPAAPPGSTGPEAPVSRVTQSLEAKLASMTHGTGLTADEVARRAEATSLDVLAKQRAVEAAIAKIDETQATFYPKLVGQARYTRLSEITPPALQFTPPGTALVLTQGNFDSATPLPAGTPLVAAPNTSSGGNAFSPLIFNNYELKATLSIPISDYVLRLSKAITAANRSRDAAELDERASRLKVGADARIAYYQWIRAQGALFVAEQAFDQAKGHRDDAKRAFDVGMASKADVLRSESAVKAAELFVERVKNASILGEEQIRVVMHDGSRRPYDIGENILADLPAVTGIDSIERAQDEAFQKRLEIRALDATEYTFLEAARVSRAGYLPRLDAQANAIYANPNTRFIPLSEQFRGTWDASLILSWTPTDIPVAKSQALGNEAKAAQIEAQKMGLRDALRMEVTQAVQALHEANVALETSRQGLAAAEESYRVRRDLYRNGRATSVEVTDSETELTRARLEAVNAHIDIRVARVRLNHALGRDITTPGTTGSHG